jgi:hypothetical protein
MFCGPASRVVLVGALLAFAASAPAWSQSRGSPSSATRGSSSASTTGGTSPRSTSIGQSNPGTIDINRPGGGALTTQTTPATGSLGSTTTIIIPGSPIPGLGAGTMALLPNSSGLASGVNGVLAPVLPNSNGLAPGVNGTLPATSSRAPVLSNSSGSVPGVNGTLAGTSSTAPVAASSGGATGRTMPECISAWDTQTHITKSRWREICARTLVEPHI